MTQELIEWLPQELIFNALALTGKTMEDMDEQYTLYANSNTEVWLVRRKFSYPKFYAYLLDKEFIEKYYPIWLKDDIVSDDYKFRLAQQFWEAIYEHQRRDEKFPEWNPKFLISLLSEIWHKNNTSQSNQ
jgi:hypothetical protein